MKEDEVKMLQDESTLRVARVLHYLIFHVGNVQLYHELRLSIGDDVGKFSELISRAQREFLRLKGEPEHKEYVGDLVWPELEDIKNVQRHHAMHGKAYIQLLLGMAAGACRRCFDERKSLGGE